MSDELFFNACMVVDMDPAEPEFEIARNQLRALVDSRRHNRKGGVE